MEIRDDGLYNIRATRRTEPGKGGTLDVFVDDKSVGQAIQRDGFGATDLSVTPGPKKLRAGQHVIARFNGELLGDDVLIVERADGL